MKSLAPLALLTFWLFSAHTSIAAIHSFYIGTRTDRDSKGIYLADFDDNTGALSNLRLATTYKDPGFLCLHPEKKLLYSIGARPDGTGTLATFAIEKNRNLTFLSDVPSGGQGPCHLAIHPAGQMIAVANYGSGSTSSFLLDPKGIPAPHASLIQHEGKSVHPQRQTGPHAHGVYFSENTLFVPDLGLDQTLAFTFDAATAKLSPATPPHASSAPGDGPRHLAIHPTKPWVYAVNELTNTVTHFVRDGHALTAKESITTLPADYKEPNTTAEIEIHPNGRFLYASNRGHQSIACYSIDATIGALTALGQTVADVKTPRHFAIAPGAAFLIVAGQDSDSLHVLAIDPQSGKLSPTSQKLSVPSPICLLFSKQ
jgi:6-phosphogluconolactonase